MTLRLLRARCISSSAPDMPLLFLPVSFLLPLAAKEGGAHCCARIRSHSVLRCVALHCDVTAALQTRRCISSSASDVPLLFLPALAARLPFGSLLDGNFRSSDSQLLGWQRSMRPPLHSSAATLRKIKAKSNFSHLILYLIHFSDMMAFQLNTLRFLTTYKLRFVTCTCTSRRRLAYYM